MIENLNLLVYCVVSTGTYLPIFRHFSEEGSIFNLLAPELFFKVYYTCI